MRLQNSLALMEFAWNTR